MSEIKNINDADALLIFSVGPVLCCSPSLSVISVMQPPVLHKPPGMGTNSGVFRHSCGMVKVIDLRQRFGVDAANWKSPGRIIVTEISGGHAGFLVDEILDVIQRPQQGWGSLPALVPRKVFRRILLKDNLIYLYAEFEDLFWCEESGYLRSHITQLTALHKPIVETLAESYVAEVRAESRNNIEDVKDHSIEIKGTEKKAVDEIVAQPVIKTARPRRPAPAADSVSVVRDAAIPGSYVEHNNASARPRVDLSHTQSQRATTDLRQILSNRGDMHEGETLKLKTKTSPDSSHVLAAHDSSEQISGNERSQRKVQTLWQLTAMPIIIVMLLTASGFYVTNYIYTKNMADTYTDKAIKVIESEVINEISSEQQHLLANVEKDAEGLVITVDAEPDEILEAVSLQAEMTVTKQDLVEQKSEIQYPQATEKTIVHIVAKGDTLWKIANLYVRNPWRYPELAKLSNIKNPHRIYPGNKVKIIKRVAVKK